MGNHCEHSVFLIISMEPQGRLSGKIVQIILPRQTLILTELPRWASAIMRQSLAWIRMAWKHLIQSKKIPAEATKRLPLWWNYFSPTKDIFQSDLIKIPMMALYQNFISFGWLHLAQVTTQTSLSDRSLRSSHSKAQEQLMFSKK